MCPGSRHEKGFGADQLRIAGETHLHHQLADRRLHLINLRREFFRARPTEVRDILTRLDASFVEWVDEPEALEWRQSQQERRQRDAVAS